MTHDQLYAVGKPGTPWSPNGAARVIGRGSGGTGRSTAASEGREANCSAWTGSAFDGRRGSRDGHCQIVGRRRAHHREMAKTVFGPKATGKTIGRPALGTAACSLSESERAKVIAEAC